MTGTNAHDVTDERHREGCAECRATWADLERISADARALPTLTPSRDLWSAIEARIDGRSESRAADPGAKGRKRRGADRAQERWFRAPAVRLAVAATLLIAATATVTWQVATGRAPAMPLASTVAAGEPLGADSLIPNLAAGDPGISRPAQLRAAANAADFSRIDVEIGALRQIVDQRLGQLDPQTVAVLQNSLTIIDQAIADSRRALLADPASPYLATELARAYSAKLNLLRTTAKLPVGT
jgi:hypothetical protein